MHKVGLEEAAGFLLLSSKFLWRQGFLRCPEYCSSDATAEACSCSCPNAVSEGRKPWDLLRLTGLSYLDNGWLRDSFLRQTDMDFSDLWELLCHVGHVGEMFTSAAPYDPTFWPLHGLAERFLTLKRLMAAANKTTLIEEWGYSHMNPLASDTHVVCDWSNVVGMERPVCTRGTCAGHRADDLLPMGNFLGKNESYTNWEFYKFTSPFNDDLPYVYDSFTRRLSRRVSSGRPRPRPRRPALHRPPPGARQAPPACLHCAPAGHGHRCDRGHRADPGFCPGRRALAGVAVFVAARRRSGLQVGQGSDIPSRCGRARGRRRRGHRRRRIGGVGAGIGGVAASASRRPSRRGREGP